MKLLVITPSFKLLGGVANHYLGLKKYWRFDVRYEFYGKRKFIPAPITFFFDLFKFTLRLIFQRPNVIIVNPSLRKYQLFRDGLYLKIAQIFKIPVVTFIHGWSDYYANFLLNNAFSFNQTFNKSTLIFILAKEFKIKLKDIGIIVPIELTTTKVNDELLENFKCSSRNGKIKEILFLARIIEEKGIFITIRAFAILKLKYPDLILRIVGTGPDVDRAQKIVK
jgi:glycosyltransferase involved in cell wall biosynthesis